MAKSTRLVNLDEVLTPDNKIVDFNRLGTSLKKADGHSVSADSYMSGGGYSYPNRVATCDKHKFTSGGYNSNHGELSLARNNLAAGSDGTQVMFAGGLSTPVSTTVVHDNCDMKQFSSDATAVDHGILSQPRVSLGGGSDGNQVMFVGGSNNGSLSICDMKQFASTATGVDHGVLNYANYSLGTGSDGNQLMLGAGISPTSVVKTSQMKQFSSTDVAVGHGSLFIDRKQLAGASDADCVMFGGGYGSGNLYICELKHFSSTSVGVYHGNLVSKLYALSAASDGTQAMFIGGTEGTTGQRSNCQRKHFASTATAVNAAFLNTNKGYLAAASGTSS